MALVANLVIGMSANTGKLSADMRKATKILNKWEGGIRSMGRRIAGIGSLILGGGIVVLVKQQLEAIDSTAKLAQQLGVTTESLQQLRFAADLTGASAKSLDAGLATMSKRLGEVARSGSGAAAPALDDLQLNVQKLVQMSPDQAFIAIAEAMAKIEEPAKRNAIAANLFSKANQGLLNTLALGKEGLKAAAAEADALGISFSAAAAGGVERANDAITAAKRAISALTQNLTITLAPALEAGAKKLATWAKVLQNVSQETWDNWIRTAKWVGGLSAATFVISRVIKIVRQLVIVYKALIKSQLFALAFSGPKGWAVIAAGAAVAAVAVAGLNEAYGDIEDAADRAARSGDKLAVANKATAGRARMAQAAITDEAEAQARLTAGRKAGVDIVARLRDQRDQVTQRFKDVRSAEAAGVSDQQIFNINALHDELDARKAITAEMEKNKKRIEEQTEAAKQFNAQWRGLRVGAVTRGSIEANRIITGLQRAAAPVPAGRDTGKQTVDELEKQTRLLTDIDKQLQDQPRVANI